MSFDPRAERTVAKVLRKRVERCGDKPWIVTEQGALTYREMDELSNRLARGFTAIGAGAGDTVLLMLPDSAAIIGCWCALAKLGAIEVPVNTHLRGSVLAHVVNDSLADTLVVHHAFLDRIAAVADELASLRRLVVETDGSEVDVSDVPSELRGRFEVLPFESLLDASSQPVEDTPKHRDLVAVMYTSGTTGPSKGVMITHAHAYEYALSVVELLELRSRDVYYNPLPLFHIAGQWAAVYACCIVEATVVIPPAFSLGGFWDDVRRHRATATFLLGAMANWLYGQPARADDADNPMERMLIVPLLSAVEDFKRRFACLVSTTWGSTEINVPTRSTFDLANNRTCGRVAADRYEVRIVGDDDAELPPGVPGEALVRAREPWILMAGYWNNPGGTVDAWRNQWVHSGDVLMRDESGNLYFVDRKKDAIRRRGENISSMEVENEINAHPSVLECAVIPVEAAHTEQDVMAVLVLKKDEILDPESFIRFLEQRMAYFMVPRYVEVLEELPKTQTGKIQKYALRERGVTPATWDREAAGVSVKR